MAVEWSAIAAQVGLAALYYAAVILIIRFAGKRLAGQITTFDLIILISLSVVLQSALLKEGSANALIFVVTVFVCHKLLAALCFRSPFLHGLVRGKPRVLMRQGQVLDRALYDEGMSIDELKAGLRKLGHESLDTIELATLEETGHISAVSAEK
jgi:uncharacterized membrane protein YcaP (DUF421 family)